MAENFVEFDFGAAAVSAGNRLRFFATRVLIYSVLYGNLLSVHIFQCFS